MSEPGAATPAIEGWFTTGDEPALLASRCTTCGNLTFPPLPDWSTCRNPACDGDRTESAALSRRGTVWSYTDAQYQPPPPYRPAGAEFEPYALAAVQLPEGLVVLGQVARGYGVGDLRVGSAVELVVEELVPGELVWKWRPTETSERPRPTSNVEADGDERGTSERPRPTSEVEADGDERGTSERPRPTIEVEADA